MPDGQWHEDPDHVNLYFTCTATVPKEEVMTTKVGEQEVRIGGGQILLGILVQLRGHVLHPDHVGNLVDVTWG